MPYTTHQDAYTDHDDCKRFEVHTAKKGDGSDTGNFQHPDDESKLLESKPVTASEEAHERRVEYDGALVRYIRTATKADDGSIVSLVKMHLVNSYLHPKANTWTKNWFWGSHNLNKLHSTFEETAKKKHPKTEPPLTTAITLLRYETAVGDDRPARPTLTQFKTMIVEDLTTLKNQAGGNPEKAIDAAKVKIGSKSISQFHAAWTSAVVKRGYSSFKAKYCSATGASSSLTWSNWTMSGESQSKVVGETFIPAVKSLGSDIWLTLFPIPTSFTDAEGNRRSKRLRT